jgi:hypothetical protein
VAGKLDDVVAIDHVGNDGAAGDADFGLGHGINLKTIRANARPE